MGLEALIKEVGDVDVLIGNFASPSFSGVQVTDLSDDQLELPFEMMVYPLHRLTRAVLPQMIKRKKGKIVVYGSASAKRGMKTCRPIVLLGLLN